MTKDGEDELSSKCADDTKKHGELMQKYNQLVKDPNYYTYEYFSELKRQVDLRRETLVEELNTRSDLILQQIDKIKEDHYYSEKSFTPSHLLARRIAGCRLQDVVEDVAGAGQILEETIDTYQTELLKNMSYALLLPDDKNDESVGDICGLVVSSEKYPATPKATLISDCECTALWLEDNDVLVCCAFEDRSIYHFNTKTQDLIKTLKWYPPKDRIQCVAFSGNGTVASVGYDYVPAHRKTYTPQSVIDREEAESTAQREVIYLWDSRTGERIDTISSPYPVYTLSFYGKLLIAYCTGWDIIKNWDVGYVLVFDVTTGMQISQIYTPASTDTSPVVVLKDGLIAVAYRKNGVGIWDIKTRRCVDVICAEEEGWSKCAFDGKDLLAIVNRKRLVIWQLSKKEVIKTANLPHYTRSVIFIGNGLVVTTHGGSAGIRMWDASLGICINKGDCWVDDKGYSPAISSDDTHMFFLAYKGLSSWKY